MTSKFSVLHFKGIKLFTHFFLMRKWPSGKVSATVSKFNVCFLYITGCFHLYWAVISLTNINVNVSMTQFYRFYKVTFVGKVCPVIFRFNKSHNALTSSTGWLLLMLNAYSLSLCILAFQ